MPRLPLLPLLAMLAPLACAEPAMTMDDVGAADFCADVERWPAEASDAELGLLAAVNEARRVGATCEDGPHPPVFPVKIEPTLRCAARVHARDLSRTGELSHTGSDGSSPLERVGAAGYQGFPRHEFLAADFLSGQEVVAAWLADPSHCAALMEASVDEVGPGARENADGDNIAWVLTTGERRPD